MYKWWVKYIYCINTYRTVSAANASTMGDLGSFS
jgi:hypothetical protein